MWPLWHLTSTSKSDTIDSVSSCFLIHDIYATHAIAVELDDVRTRNKCFGWWILCSSDDIRYPNHIISMCCQKENRLVAIPFAENDAFRIMKITFAYGNFLTFAIPCSLQSDLTVLFLWGKLYLQKIYRSMLGC